MAPGAGQKQNHGDGSPASKRSRRTVPFDYLDVVIYWRMAMVY
ncbi:hypothetical protein [Neobacillus cucumis]